MKLVRRAFDVSGVILVQTRREGKTSHGVLHSSLLAEAVIVLKSPDSSALHSQKFLLQSLHHMKAFWTSYFDTWQSVFVAAAAALFVRGINIAEDNSQDTVSNQKITLAL